MPDQDLTDLFLQNGIDEEELKIILSQADAEARDGVFGYYGGEVKVTFNRSGRIRSIRGNPESPLVNVALRNIQDAIITDHGTRVGRSIFFCTVPLNGSYRYLDEFQIQTMEPSTEYGPTTGWGDFPFVLEAAYSSSSNGMLDAHRRSRALNRTLRVLNLISKWGLYTLAHDMTWVRVPKAWADPTEEDIEMGLRGKRPSHDTTAMHLNIGYSAPEGFLVYADDFSPISTPPIEQIESQTYYGQIGIAHNYIFSLPAFVDEIVASYYNLSDPAEKFDIALYWYEVADRVATQSRSLSFVSLIQAIETMCDSEPESENCETCGDPVLIQTQCENCGKVKKARGPTRLFREFIDQYTQNLPARLRNEMYSMRSKITHGTKIMVADQDLRGFDQKSHEEQEMYRIAKSVTQISLLNWLRSQQEGAT